MKRVMLVLILIIVAVNIGAAQRVGYIRNVTYTTSGFNTMMIYQNACSECICYGFFSRTPPSYVGLNCYKTNKTCKLFANYSSPSTIQNDLNSDFIFIQQPPSQNTAVPVSVTTMMPSTMTTIPQLVVITRPGDRILGLCNTTAGDNTGTLNASFITIRDEGPSNSIDGQTSTKYVNQGAAIGDQTGINTGFYVTPSVNNRSVVRALRFATANDNPNRDPITVTLEGSNVSTFNQLDLGSSWTLIYNGSTGINTTSSPGNQTYCSQKKFNNSIAYAHYRLLVTSQRGPDNSVQYSEVEILGYL